MDHHTDHREDDDKDPTELDEATHNLDFAKNSDSTDIDENKHDQP